MVRLILGKNRIDRLFELDSNSRILPRDHDFLETYFFRIEGKKIYTENLTRFPG